MKDIIKLTEADIRTIVQRAVEKKKQQLLEQEAAAPAPPKANNKLELPDSCFGGPKTGLGGLVLFTTMLQREADGGDINSEKLLSDLKTFLKGLTKAKPDMMANLLKKYGKEKYMPWVGCF